LVNLVGIKRIEGLILENKDIIIFGPSDTLLPELNLDDFVVALKSANGIYSQQGIAGNRMNLKGPACTIDPTPEAMRVLNDIASHFKGNDFIAEQEWMTTCGVQQTVLVINVPKNIRFSRVMVEADYFMKKINNGTSEIKLNGFRSLNDFFMRYQNRKDNNVLITNRFWFRGDTSYYSQTGNTYYLISTPVILSTEQEFQSSYGNIYGTGKPNPIAQKYSIAFTKCYDEIATKKTLYTDLFNLYRFIEIAKLIYSESSLNIDYILQHYNCEPVVVPDSLKGIADIARYATSFYSAVLPTCGGVDIDPIPVKYNSDNPTTGKLNKIHDAIIQSKPDKYALCWGALLDTDCMLDVFSGLARNGDIEYDNKNYLSAKRSYSDALKIASNRKEYIRIYGSLSQVNLMLNDSNATRSYADTLLIINDINSFARNIMNKIGQIHNVAMRYIPEREPPDYKNDDNFALQSSTRDGIKINFVFPSERPISNDLENLKVFVGKYTFNSDGKIFEVLWVKNKLKIMLGEKYKAFIDYIGTQPPISINKNILIIEGCFPHSCGTLEAILAINLNDGAFHVCLHENNAWNLFTENVDRIPKDIYEWKDKN
jgi:hypothetical protein